MYSVYLVVKQLAVVQLELLEEEVPTVNQMQVMIRLRTMHLYFIAQEDEVFIVLDREEPHLRELMLSEIQEGTSKI